jgi:hypothetical protein
MKGLVNSDIPYLSGDFGDATKIYMFHQQGMELPAAILEERSIKSSPDSNIKTICTSRCGLPHILVQHGRSDGKGEGSFSKSSFSFLESRLNMS